MRLESSVAAAVTPLFSMSPEFQPPNSKIRTPKSPSSSRPLQPQTESERLSRIIVVVLGILAVVAFIWMHLHLFELETLGALLHSLLRVDVFFLARCLPSPCIFGMPSMKTLASSFGACQHAQPVSSRTKARTAPGPRSSLCI